MSEPATLLIETPQRYGAVDITGQVAAAVTDPTDGTWLVSTVHTTAGLVLGPADRGQMADYARFAEHAYADLAPFQHVHDGDDVRNGREHLLSTVVGTRLMLDVREGSPVLGRWQRILLLEFDGPKQRRISVRRLGGG